jgi:hypothetical protein
MPLPSDEKLITLCQDLLQQLDTIFGLHSTRKTFDFRQSRLA